MQFSLLQPFPNSNNKQLSSTLKKILGFTPRNIQYYEIAFIHKSASVTHADGSIINNERLEYLGDAILDAVISDILFTLFPGKNEGFLTRMRARMVSREKLNEMAFKLGVDQLIISQTGSNQHVKNIPGNTVEALIGAIYIDRGFYRTKKFITRKMIKPHLDLVEIERDNPDYKSQLIEWSQKNRVTLKFINKPDGKDKKLMRFVTVIKWGNRNIGKGTGLSKKEAAQNAAEEALKYLQQENQDKKDAPNHG